MNSFSSIPERITDNLAQSLHLHRHNERGTLPILIGLTGHRDLRPNDKEILSEQIQSIFKDFSERYPHTPLVLLTSLAEGADRLGSEIALQFGMEVITPLPFHPDEYEKDFQTENSKTEFRKLLAAASRSFVIPFAEGVTEENIAEQYNRDAQYASVGAYIARYSQILIALWDGKHLDRQGGTSQIVRLKLEGEINIDDKEQNPLDPPESGPVYQVITPRSTGDAVGTPYALHKIYPKSFPDDTAAERTYQRIFEQIDKFNADVVEHRTDLAAAREQSKQWLFPQEHYTSLSTALLSTIDNFAVADTLASYFQKFTFQAFKGLFTLVLLAATFFDLYAHLYHEEKIVLVGYFLTLIAAFVWYERAKRKQFQSKYLDYRALAEGLRVQFYWQYAGIRNSVSEYYIRKQRSELEWIRYALRTLSLPADDESLRHQQHTAESRMQRMEITIKHWVEDQAKYYKKAMHRDHIQLHKLERTINIVFFIGVALAAVQLFLHPNHYLIVAIGLAPILAALIGSYVEKNGLVGHIKQFERMSALFAQAQTLLRKFLDDGNRSQISILLFELGREALGENGDWILQHRERPLEVPKG